jgi:hypothetical protein
MNSQLNHGRAAARRIAVALGFAALLAAGSASAWEYPLLPHVNGLAFFPETPSTEYRTTALLSAYYPGECWRLVDTLFVDSARVRVTISRATGCGDSVSYWMQRFDLGYLAAGMHELTVHCTVLDDGVPPVEEEITVPFEVVQAAPPPPPPVSALPLLEIIEVHPQQPAPGEAVTIRLRGFKPFACTLIHEEAVVDPHNIQGRFTQQESCADTSQRWTRDFAMGSYLEGDQTVNIRLYMLFGPDSASVLEYAALFHVGAAPPPPPPVDSSKTGLSSGRPNPFRDETMFAVTLEESQSVEVAVFDLVGRRVATLHRGVLPVGTTTLAWNGRRTDGSRAPGGIYFYQLKRPGQVINRRVVLLATP